MRINKLYFGFLLILVLFISDEVSSNDTALNVINAGLPALTAVLAAALEASPAGPLVVGLGLLHVASMVFFTEPDDPNAISKLDLQELKAGLDQQYKDLSARIATSTANIIAELTYAIEAQQVLSDMRSTLDRLQRGYDHHMHFILKHRLNATETTGESMSIMLKDDSWFRDGLSSFISNFITPSLSISQSSQKLFFELLIEKNRLLARESKDCYTDSLHSRMFKSYLLITKILTNSFAMVLSAYTIKYQTELKRDPANAADIKSIAQDLMGEYHYAMGNLTETAKNALNDASREIRNCSSFTLMQGKNFAHLPFLTTVLHRLPGDCSRNDEDPINFSDYTTFNCSSPKDLSITFDRDTFYDAYYNKTDTERPLVHIKNGNTIMLGHDVPKSTGLQKAFHTKGYCFPHICAVYKRPNATNKVAGVCTAVAKAKQDNVITGVRFKIRENILYIDIQEGKLVNETEIDPAVHWTETECRDPRDLSYFDQYLKAIEIDDIMLGDGDYVTSVGLYKAGSTEHQDGIIWLQVGRNWRFSEAYRPQSLSSNEITLTEPDDPEHANSERLISNPPDPKKAAYIQFQTTSVKKDLGRTTVPYIDTREVVSNPPSPLSGIGIYHAASTEDGGLLGLKLFSHKLSKYVDYNQILKITSPIS